MELANLDTILQHFHQGNTSEYNVLVKNIRMHNQASSDFQIPDATLELLLEMLSQNAILLGWQCSDLVFEVLKVDWFNKDVTVLKQLHNFMCNLVCAQSGSYILGIVDAIALYFRPKETSSVAASGINIQPEHSNAFRCLNTTLATILHLAPSARLVLGEVLHKRFPPHMAPFYSQKCYVYNLLKVMGYETTLVSPKLRRDVLKLIVSHLIKIDACISRDEMQNAEKLMELGKDIQPMLEHGTKLDILLAILFHFIYTKCCPNRTYNENAAKELYQDLRECFDCLLLRTHKSGHIQYLLFYICGFSKTFADNFLSFLWGKFEKVGNESMYRQVAAMYLASFLTRAKYISTSTAKHHLLKMRDFIIRYISFACDTSLEPDARHHGPFYALCQALFYVFSFRHKELLNSEKGRTFCKGLNLQKIVSSDLNPLKFCRPNIAVAFSTIARHNYIAMCDTVLEKNRRCYVPEINNRKIDVFDLEFPFEPYLLEESRQYITPFFQEYECPDTFDMSGEQGVMAEEDIEELVFMDIDNGNSDDESFSLNAITTGSIDTFMKDLSQDIFCF